MTTRERSLAGIFGCLILGVAVGGPYYTLYHVPMNTLEREITDGNADFVKKSQAVRQEGENSKKLLDASPRLEKWQTLSLPDPGTTDTNKIHSFQDNLQGDYLKYLDGAMRKAGYSGANFTITPKEISRKSATTQGSAVSANKSKAPPFLTYSYSVTATGPYKDLLAVMESLYKSPVLHEIKTLSIEKPDPKTSGTANLPAGSLKSIFTVEVLQVVGAEKYDGKKPPIPEPGTRIDVPVLASAGRDYQSLTKIDMFQGKAQEPKKEVKKGPERLKDYPLLVEGPMVEPTVTAKKTEPVREVLGVIKLTQITDNGRRWEAYCYNQATGSERLLTLGIRRDFEFQDKYENVMLKGEVVNIATTRGIYFRSEGKVYRWGIGETLEEATRRPLAIMAEGKKVLLLKGVEEVDGLAVMSLGDVGEPYSPRSPVPYGLGVGLAGLMPPTPTKTAAGTTMPVSAPGTGPGTATGPGRNPRIPTGSTRTERVKEGPVAMLVELPVEPLKEGPVEVVKVKEVEVER